MKIRIGIVGYGNLGRGTECAVCAAEDMELVINEENMAAIGLTVPEDLK